MEFKQVIGRRRSIRHFLPWKPVEREKIQAMLEAAHQSSCAVNASFLQVIVVERDKLPKETLEKLKTPVSANNLELAPVHLYFYADLEAIQRTKGQPLKDLVDAGTLTPSHGWSHKFVDELVWPFILEPITQDLGRYQITAAFDCGVAACQALLTAYDEGLGACLSAFFPEPVKELFHVPDHWLPLWLLAVGYPAAGWEDGGRRPRPKKFEEQFCEGDARTPFRRDPEVVKALEQAGMITRPAPTPGRKEEVRGIARMLGLPE
jgi:nitroreductase